MSRPRIAVVGAGAWARSMHLPAMRGIQASGRAEYVGVCDLDEAKAAALARDLGCRSFGAVDAMVDALRPDALALLVNPPAMPDAIRAAARQGLPFLAEKPPATDTATHLDLMRVAGSLPHVVAYNRRHCPYMTRVKEWLSGIVPQIVCAQFTRHRRFDADFSTTAVHPIDTALFLAGSPLSRAVLECAPNPPSAIPIGGPAPHPVLNYYVGGWTDAGTRVEILITPDTASSMEHYAVRSAERSAVLAFPQPGMLDFPGFVELHEANRMTARLSAADWGIDPADGPSLGGIRDEHLRLVAVLESAAPSVSTLSSTLATQRVREALVGLMRRGGRGKAELEIP